MDGGSSNLIAWQRAIDLVESVYRLSADWPGDERFGLCTQARRSAVSIPSNIVEGAGRTGTAEFRHHLSIAHGSLCELETQLVIAERLGFDSRQSRTETCERAREVGRLLRGLLKKFGEPR